MGGVMQPNYREFHPGQAVRSVYGENLIVVSQLGCQVFVEGKPSEWYHPSKLSPLADAPPATDTQPDQSAAQVKTG